MLTIPQLLYGSKIWIRKAKHMFRIQGAEMKFPRAVRDYTRRDNEYIRNDHARSELGIVESLRDIISW